MSVFVNETGFVRKTFEENKTYYETEFQAIFGADIDLDPTGPIGQIVALLAKRDTDLWEGAEEIYNSRNPNSATGISLDNICAETGVIRQPQGSTFVFDVTLTGDLLTVIPAGSKARQASGEIDFSLTESVTFSLSNARIVELEIGTPAEGDVFTVTINGTDYTYTALISDDDASVASELKDLIDAGSFIGTASVVGNILTISLTTMDFEISFTANITIESLSIAGVFQADSTGPYPVPANTLDTIVTPVSGWDSITNPSSGVVGRNRETDAELRIRRANTLITGNATEDAILNAVQNNVTSVSSVSILSNRTDVTDVNNLPPHSFEVVVSGGADADIAENIWSTMPAGIATYGNTSEDVVDSQGQTQTIYFSRPTAVYIHVKVKRDLYTEETYPTAGDTLIKDAIVAWAQTYQTLGKDVIRQRLSIPVYSIPGIADIEITIDATANPGDTPTYASDDLPIAIREYADFATARIVVEDLTP